MKHPAYHATTVPEKTAYQMAGSGKKLTFAELDAASNQGAHALRSLGIHPGDHIAFMLENRLELLSIAWAAQRSGVIFTLISRYLTADEAAYIVRDCGAKVFITSDRYADTGQQIRMGADGDLRSMMVGQVSPGFQSWDKLTITMPTTPVLDECAGAAMLYSSGTTGRPKGIVRKYPDASIESLSPVVLPVFEDLAGMTDKSVYLSPAPLYHSAPLAGAMVAAGLGASTIVMERFDEEQFLAEVENHQVTHTQMVPTMFVRLLKLPEKARNRHKISTLTGAVHVAAPCPVEIKRRMIDWWGPIIVEYYAGTEGNGVTACTSSQWLSHPGTVGRPLFGNVHILDNDRNPLPAGEIGDVFFDAGQVFSYHGDKEKTANAFTSEGWSTLGDIGWKDEDGFVYLTDRRAYTIISGGVNVYPQETEDLLINHPAVTDVAVFGVPNDELGEEVKAVVQPANDREPGPDLEAELIGYCRQHLSSIKTPKSIDFKPEMPRTPTGKLMKRFLKNAYWP